MIYYDSLYDKYFHSRNIDKGLQSGEYSDATYENYLFHLVNLTNKNRDFNALPGLKDIWKILDLRNIARLTSTQDTFEVACEIASIIIKNVESSKDVIYRLVNEYLDSIEQLNKGLPED